MNATPYGFEEGPIRLGALDIYRCTRCGSLVASDDTNLHDNWHDGAESDDE